MVFILTFQILSTSGGVMLRTCQCVEYADCCLDHDKGVEVDSAS